MACRGHARRRRGAGRGRLLTTAVAVERGLMTSAFRSRAGVARVLLLLLGVSPLGCVGGKLPERSNPERAEQALRTALDAWRKDEPLDALAARAPAIYFNDPKARDGARLVSY